MARQLTAPDGTEIIGTLETIPGVAYCSTITRDSSGALCYEHEGGTRVDWDGQETVEFADEAVFIDSEGRKWLGRELVELGDE